ncbi:MAG: TraB/GumN family protein [Chitinophagaceae bacterium]|nr:MAG: TraB/GumN family protein [Chitinophagaceae bacterium]
MKRRSAALLLLLFLVSITARSQERYPSTLLWRISGKGLAQPSYLYGTMHVTDKRLFRFQDSLYAALDATRGFAMEIDPEKAFGIMFRLMSDDEDTTSLLSKSTDPRVYSRVAPRISRELGLPADKVTRKQLWIYQQQKLYKPAASDDMPVAMDLYLYNLAREQDKWVGGIEDVEDQVGLLGDISLLLDGDENESTGSMESMIRMYLAQDLNGLVQVSGGMDSLQADRLLLQRNAKMARRIDSLAHERATFFAIGALHLPGPGSVIERLREAGFSVSPVIGKRRLEPAQYRYKKVERPWVPVSGESSAFTVQMPGQPQEISYLNNAFRMQVHLELGSGTCYFLMPVPVGEGLSADTMVSRMAQMYRNSGVASGPITDVSINGRKGKELSVRKSGYFYRTTLIAGEGEVVLLMVGGQKKEQLHSEAAVRFFGSLQAGAPRPRTARADNWYPFRDSLRGVRMEFPGKPARSREMGAQLERNDGSSGNQTFIDVSTQTVYSLLCFDLGPDQNGGDEGIAAMAQTMMKKEELKVMGYDSLQIDGRKAYRLKMRLTEMNLPVWYLITARDNRIFTAMVITQMPSLDTVRATRFLESFSFLPYVSSHWQEQTDSAASFRAFGPAAFVMQASEGSEQRHHRLFAQDPASGNYCVVDVQRLSRFALGGRDSSFYEGQMNSYLSRGDSVLRRFVTSNGAAQGRGYELATQKGASRMGLRLIPQGDTLYNLLYQVAQSTDTQPYDSFLNSFRLTHAVAPEKQMPRGDVATLLAGLRSTDSATHADALAYLPEAPLERQDLPLLETALQATYPDGDTIYYSSMQTLLDALAPLADSGTVALVSTRYAGLSGDAAANRSGWLELLARMKTRASYTTLAELLGKHGLPDTRFPFRLSNQLTDSTDLFREILPALVGCLDDRSFAPALLEEMARLVDSGRLRGPELERLKPAMLALARSEVGALVMLPEEDAWGLWNWMRFLGAVGGVEAPGLLQQVLRSRLTAFHPQAVQALLKLGHIPAAADLRAAAASPDTRLALFRVLEEEGRAALFPGAYHTQPLFAESGLYEWLADADEGTDMHRKIVPAGHRDLLFEGKRQRFYLFRVETPGNEPARTLGIVGPLPVTGKAVSDTGAATTLLDAPYNPARTDRQLKQHLRGLEEEAAAQPAED